MDKVGISVDCRHQHDERYRLKTLENGLAVLLLFTPRRPHLTLKEVDQNLGLGKTRAFKILRTLMDSGFIKKATSTGGYSLGPAAAELGLSALGQMDILKLAPKILAELAEQTRETSILTMRRGDYSVIVAKTNSPLSVRMAAEVGGRSLINAGGSNVALLAFGGQELIDRFLSGAVPLKRFTEHTPVTPDAIISMVMRVRATGYHVSKGEVEPDIMAIGAPVFRNGGVAEYCCSIAGPEYRMTPKEPFLIEKVLCAAAELSRLLAAS